MLEGFFHTFRVRSVKRGFFSIGYDDLKFFALMMLETAVVWAAGSFEKGFTSIYQYWDGPNYVYAARTMYNIPNDNPWTKYYHYPPSYFACHLPGLPTVIRVFSFFTNGNYYCAGILSIVFCDFFMCYAFMRLSKLLDLKNYMALAVLPIRLSIYHSVIASEPLFIAFTCMAFIFYYIDKPFLALISVWGCCVTRIEGMLVGAVIGFCFLCRKQVLKGFLMFLTFLAPASVVLLHKVKFNDPLAYLHFNQNSQGLIGFPPFHELISFQRYQQDQDTIYSLIYLYVPLIFGSIMLYSMSGPLAIFSSAYLLYVSLLRHIDPFRYSIPAGVFCLSFIPSNTILYVAAAILIPVYASGQIPSNVCGDIIMKEVYE